LFACTSCRKTIRNGISKLYTEVYFYACKNEEYIFSGRPTLEVLTLNILLFPDGWNTYDSYGEALANEKLATRSISPAQINDADYRTNCRDNIWFNFEPGCIYRLKNY
jgi:hypothetical protein